MPKRFWLACPLMIAAAAAAGGSLLIFQHDAVPSALSSFVPSGWSASMVALALHLAAALLAAVAAMMAIPGRRGRLTLALLFSLLSLTLPLVGLAGVIVLLLLFSTRPGDDSHPEDRFVFGVPRMVDGSTKADQFEPEPLAGTLRRLPASGLGPAILGLKNIAHHDRLPLLRRFQNDEDAQLQFFAQGVLVSGQEELEASLRKYEARLAEEPKNIDAHTAAAEICLELAQFAPPADVASAEVQARAALEHVNVVKTLAPKCPAAFMLACQAHLILGDVEAAAESLRVAYELTPNEPCLPRLGAILLHEEERYTELADLLGKRPDLAPEAAAFWRHHSTPCTAAS